MLDERAQIPLKTPVKHYISDCTQVGSYVQQHHAGARLREAECERCTDAPSPER